MSYSILDGDRGDILGTYQTLSEAMAAMDAALDREPESRIAIISFDDEGMPTGRADGSASG